MKPKHNEILKKSLTENKAAKTVAVIVLNDPDMINHSQLLLYKTNLIYQDQPEKFREALIIF